MIRFKTISTAPLEPYERSTVAKYKTFSKLESDFNKLKQAAPNIFNIKFIRTGKDNEGLHYVEFWCVIPSEPFPKFLHYDVIVRFYFDSDSDRRINMDSLVEVYSNSPSFTFTYAYVYNKKDASIKDYNRYLSRKSITDAPKVTNPKELIGFEKSLFFAFLLLKSSTVFSSLETYLSSHSGKLVNTPFKPDSAEEKLQQYNIVKSKEKTLYNEYKKRNSFGFF